MNIKPHKNMSLRDMDGEIWMTVSGYPMYEVSNLGRVCAKERAELTTGFSDRVNHNRKIKRRIFKQTLQGGYLHVSLYKGKGCIKETFVVHRLVALHFIKNPENKPEVNHKKGIKTDNRAVELEWNTHAENMRHAHDTGLKYAKYGSAHPMTKFTESDVIRMRKLHKSGVKVSYIAREYNSLHSTVWRIVAGRSFKYVKQ